MSARDDLIERAARAYYEWACGLDDDFGDSDPSRWDAPDALGLYPHKEFARERAAMFLDAFMAEPRAVLDLLGVEQVGKMGDGAWGGEMGDLPRFTRTPKDGTP